MSAISVLVFVLDRDRNGGQTWGPGSGRVSTFLWACTETFIATGNTRTGPPSRRGVDCHNPQAGEDIATVTAKVQSLGVRIVEAALAPTDDVMLATILRAARASF